MIGYSGFQGFIEYKALDTMLFINLNKTYTPLIIASVIYTSTNTTTTTLPVPSFQIATSLSQDFRTSYLRSCTLLLSDLPTSKLLLHCILLHIAFTLILLVFSSDSVICHSKSMCAFPLMSHISQLTRVSQG